MYSDDSLRTNRKENQALLIQNDKCDKYDYLLAVGCGAIGGMIDIFLLVLREKVSFMSGQTHRQIIL